MFDDSSLTSISVFGYVLLSICDSVNDKTFILWNI